MRARGCGTRLLCWNAVLRPRRGGASGSFPQVAVAARLKVSYTAVSPTHTLCRTFSAAQRSVDPLQRSAYHIARPLWAGRSEVSRVADRLVRKDTPGTPPIRVFFFGTISIVSQAASPPTGRDEIQAWLIWVDRKFKRIFPPRAAGGPAAEPPSAAPAGWSRRPRGRTGVQRQCMAARSGRSKQWAATFRGLVLGGMDFKRERIYGNFELACRPATEGTPLPTPRQVLVRQVA